LIARVLNELEGRIEKDVAEPSVRDKAIAMLNDLPRRIAWGRRVAQVLSHHHRRELLASS